MPVTWNGTTFPYACVAEGGPFPMEAKIIKHPGVDGVSKMDMGKRERTFTIKGRLLDAKTGTPNAKTLYDLDTSKAATLTDELDSYPNCIVMGESTRCFNYVTAMISGVRRLTCEYEVTFEQLRS